MALVADQGEEAAPGVPVVVPVMGRVVRPVVGQAQARAARVRVRVARQAVRDPSATAQTLQNHHFSGRSPRSHPIRLSKITGRLGTCRRRARGWSGLHRVIKRQ